jgi:prepilin-type processing-associated H-X9-DG protein
MKLKTIRRRSVTPLVAQGPVAVLPKRDHVQINGHSIQGSLLAAFSLMELLMLISLIAILAALLLPALSRAKTRGQSISCLNNLRQMQLAWLNYTDDSDGVMPLNLIENAGLYARDLPGSWVLGSAWAEAALTNITSGTLYPYVGNARSYLCPADLAKTDGTVSKPVPVNRSYSTQCSLHSEGYYFATTAWPAPYLKYPECVKLSAILTPGPTGVWGFIEPSEAGHDIASWDFFVMQLNVMWAHQPSDRHSFGCNLSFLDGHAQRYGWKAAHEKRGSIPALIQPGGDRDDYNHLLAGVPRAR